MIPQSKFHKLFHRGISVALTGACLNAAVSCFAFAQSGRSSSISVGRISSAKTCKLYQEYEGRSAFVATPYAIGAASSWRTWFVKDCVDNFASIRTSLLAALASSGALVVKSAGGTYVVEGRISEVSGGDDPAPVAPNPGDGFSYSINSMFVNMDVTVRNQKGQIIFGLLLTKHLEIGSDVKTSDFRAYSSRSGEAVYTQLQHQVALAVARAVSFRLVPLEVTENLGRKIRLNYGAPLLALGTIVQATSADGATVVRYSVTSAGSGSATAQVDGGGDATRITAGSTAIVIESDDPAANGRRFEKVDLP